MELEIENSSLTGRKAHIWQRISAIYLMFYIPLLATVVMQLPASPTLIALESNLSSLSYSGLFAISTLAALILLFVHAWVGVRDIIIDYAPRARVKLWLTLYQSLLALVLINCVYIVVNLLGYA